MRMNFSIAALLLVATTMCMMPAPVKAGENGGTNCAACTVVFQIVFNLAGVHEQEVDVILENFCTLLPDPFENPCIEFVHKFGDKIIDIVAQGGTADDVCHALDVCTEPTCRLFPKKSQDIVSFTKIANGVPSRESPWDWLKQLLEKLVNEFANEHLPIKDFDSDKFSTVKTLRGSDWRGKDCDDLSDKVYPGRLNTSLPAIFDHNCNGISGHNTLFKSYESLYCDGTDQRGLINLGDSATAHFRIPPQYMNASEINKNTYDHILMFLENEADWPHRSWGSGHLNDTTGDCEGPLESIYLQMLDRNRCMFRDYQNIGVNGARSGSMKPPGIIESMARDAESDHPALVIYALIGNDVCHPAHDLGAMTTPEDFEQNVLASLVYLNNTLPKGSHVAFAGLVDGRVLWDTMHARTHPLGCNYEELYDFLNCLYVSPCWGWLNSNGTVRNATSARAKELNQVYEKIIQENTFEMFDMAYYNTPLAAAFTEWIKMGGQPYELIEPVDGFHPSQIANALIGKILFEKILKENPDFIGPVNPNNDKIIQMFGDQGGY